MTMLRRKILNDFMEWMGRPYEAVLQVNGARQVGKTYLINHFIRENYENHLELNFVEEPDLKELFEGSLDVDTVMSRISLRFPEFHPELGNTIIFLDEIQECPNAKTAFKPFVEDGRYRIIASAFAGELAPEFWINADIDSSALM